mgnify:FL=1
MELRHHYDNDKSHSLTTEFYCTDCGSEVVHCAVVELHTLVDKPPAAGLLILPVLDDLIHWDVSLETRNLFLK